MTSPGPVRGRTSKKSIWRLGRGLAIILVVTGASIWSVTWWEDRPLRQIERALDRKDFNSALELATAYLGAFPERSEALDQKARALAGLGRWSEAARLFDRTGALSIASQRAWSQALLHEERWSEALPLLKRLNELSPADDADLLHELAACETKLGFFDEAVDASERLLKLPGQEARGRLLLGMIHYKKGNNRLAAESWIPILDRNPEAADLQVPPDEFFEELGQTLLDDGRAAEARPYLEHAVLLTLRAEPRIALAECCERLGESPSAVALWREVIAREPQNRSAREGLARTSLEKHAPDEARDWLEPLLARDDLRSTTAYLMQRAALLKGDSASAALWDGRVQGLRKHESRLAAFDHALRVSPQSYWSRALRAHRFATEGNVHEATFLTEALLAERPDQPFVRQLAEAIRDQKPLPSLDLIPYERF